jgi:hypothetical protein
LKSPELRKKTSFLWQYFAQAFSLRIQRNNWRQHPRTGENKDFRKKMPECQQAYWQIRPKNA